MNAPEIRPTFVHPFGGPDAHSSEHALWLEIATAGLWRPARRLITEETTAHLEQAEAQGHTPEGALAQLGDPRESATAYRKVHLQDEEMAFLNRHQARHTQLNARPWVYVLVRALPMVPGSLLGLSLLAQYLPDLLKPQRILLAPDAHGFMVGYLSLIVPLLVYLTAAPFLLRGRRTLEGVRSIDKVAAVCVIVQYMVFAVGLLLTVIDGAAKVCGCGGAALALTLQATDTTPPLLTLLVLLGVTWVLLLIDRERTTLLGRAHTLYGLQKPDLQSPPPTPA